jgi:preprotein translocase subunit SecA
MDRLKMPEGEAIEAGIVTRSIESAQRKVEGHNFDMRKQLLEYDDVSNDQRKVIYQQRNEILETVDVAESIANLRKGALTDVVRTFVPNESLEEQWDLPTLERVLAEEWHVEVDLVKWVEGQQAADDEDVLKRVIEAANAAYDAKVSQVGAEQFASFERMVLLQSIDSHWREHLAALDYLRQGIHLRGYAQKNPKQEYKREAFELFGQLLSVVKMDVTGTLLKVRIQSQEEAQQAAAAIEQQGDSFLNVTYTHPTEDGGVATEADPATQVAEVPRVGRNEPCPCGSGEKYKNCHGKLA